MATRDLTVRVRADRSGAYHSAMSAARENVDRITAEAREIDLGRSILTMVAAILWLAGWVAGKVVGLVFAAIAWSFAAVKVGWQDARARGRDGGG